LRGERRRTISKFGGAPIAAGHSRRRLKCDLIAKLINESRVKNLNLEPERLGLRRHPPGLMHEGIQLGERHAELVGEAPTEGRLAVAADAGDDDAAGHRAGA